MIQTKRAYDDPEPDDGFRVLVDRLWPRGIKKEDLRLDRWMREIAPGDELRKWVHEDPEGRWEAFRERYAEQLADRQQEVEMLRDKAREGTLTLVYAARDRDRNNAVALRDHLLEGLDES